MVNYSNRIAEATPAGLIAPVRSGWSLAQGTTYYYRIVYGVW